MRTLLMEVTPGGNDELVKSVIADHSDEGFGGVDRFIGVLNEHGELYRVIVAESPIQASGLVDVLTSNGWIDRIGVNPETYDEVDSLTGNSIRSGWTALLQTSKISHPIPALPNLSRAVWEEMHSSSDEEEIDLDAQVLLNGLRPTGSPRVVDLLKEAGVNVTAWGVNKKKEVIDPYTLTETPNGHSEEAMTRLLSASGGKTWPSREERFSSMETREARPTSGATS